MSSAKKFQDAGSRLSGGMEFSIWIRAIFFGLAYFLCAEAGSYLSVRGGNYISFWLPAGLSVAVLLLNRPRDWIWLLLATLPANVTFDLLYDAKPNPAIIISFYFANVVQSSTGAWLVRRFVAKRPTLGTIKEFAGLICFAGVFSTLLGAIVGAGTLVHFGLSHSFFQSLKVWWGSTAMAVLVLTPFILAWFSKPDRTRNYFDSPGKTIEAALLFLGLAALIGYLIFLDKGIMSAHKSMVIPFLLWAGLRFGLRMATSVTLLISLVFSFFTSQFFIGLTPAQISSGEYVFVLQMVLAMASLVALIPAITISERDKSLAGLRESEERFKTLSAAAFEGICITEDGVILDVNNQFLTMFGYQNRAEVIGRKIVELVAPEWQESVAGRIRAGQETVYEPMLVRKDGGIFPAETQSKMIREGGRNLRMSALRDITGLKKAEAALRESEEKFSKAFQSNPNGICISEMENGRYIEVNESYCRLFGYSREEMIGHSSLQMGIWEKAIDRERMVQPLRDSGSLRDLQIQTRDRNQQAKIILISAEIIELRGKRCIVFMLHDITEREAAISREQLARTEYTFQLIASQEAERTRIARELHDSLGQNLLLIKNRAQLEMAKTELSDSVREQFQDISNLASLAITEAQQISYDLHPHQLDHLGLTLSLKAMIENADESSVIEIDEKIDSVDEVFSIESAMNIYRIVQESLNNILKHSRAKHARITLERDIHEVILKIEDDGCGFNANEDQKGLGLRNVAERVRMLGGKLKVESAPGQGVHLKITIPISAEAR